MKTLKRAGQGFTFLILGWRFLSAHPGLRKWTLIPLFVDLMLLLVGWSLGVSQVPVWVAQSLGIFVTPAAGLWFSLLYYPLLILFGIGFLVLWLYLVFILASLVAAPFNAILAEKCLIQLGITPANGGPLKLFFKMLRASLVKTVLFLIIGVFLFFLSFIPIINIFSIFGALLIMAFDCADYSFEVTGLGLRQRMSRWRGNLPEFAGMAGGLSLTLFVPGLTLLLLPVAVVGSAVVLVDAEKRSM